MRPSVAIRSATPHDREAILAVVREAFSRGGSDGQEEVDIVVSTWRLDAVLDGLELVAVQDDTVIGHALGARGDLAGRAVVGVAPLGVAPSHQGRGVGSELMTELISRADAGGYALVALLGNPAYYGRFGFEPSGQFNIFYPPVGVGDPHFQVRPLSSYQPSYSGEFTYCWEKARGRSVEG